MLNGRKVLVTGAAGFIGSHLCDRLARHGIEVCAVSRRFTPVRKGSVSYQPGDLSDLEATRTLLRAVKPEVIFHLAGLAAGARDPSLVVPTFQSNLASTVNLLVAALETGKPRVVLPGSLEEPTEADALASSPYAMSKWAASSYGRMFCSLYQLPVAIGRVFITYGPTSKDLHKLIPYVTLALLRDDPPRLASGRRQVDWVHVDDVVDGLIALATAQKAIGATVDIGSGRLMTIRSLVERIVELVQPARGPLFDALPERPFEQVRVADVDRAFELTGWRPKVDFDAGLKSTVEWFRAHAGELGAK